MNDIFTILGRKTREEPKTECRPVPPAADGCDLWQLPTRNNHIGTVVEASCINVLISDNYGHKVEPLDRQKYSNLERIVLLPLNSI